MVPEATEQWWIADQGTAMGPFPTEHVRSELKLGHISTSSQICRSGETQWKPLGEFQTFAAVAASSATAPPAQSQTTEQPVLKWEYLVKYITDYRGLPEDASELTQLGANGWELTAVQHPYFYFRRAAN